MRLLHSLLARYRRRSRSRGQSIVELALILPVLMLLVASTLDLGRMFYSQVTITNAAREGAYEAAYQPTSFVSNGNCDKTTNRVMCRVLSEAKGSFVQVAKADVSLACSPSCAKAIDNTVTVTVLGHFKLLTPIMAPFLGGSDVVLTSTATAQIVTDPPLVGAAPTATPSPTPSPSPSPSPTPSPTPTGTGPTPSPTPTATPTPTPVPCFAPVANFTVNPTGGFKNTTTFNFTDTSQWMPVGSCNTVWSWNFGDGSGQSNNNAGTSTAQNPSYIYTKHNNSPGFTVTLAASNSMGSSTKTLVVRVDP
jgi:Flp pilus assembly protein TadG